MRDHQIGVLCTLKWLSYDIHGSSALLRQLWALSCGAAGMTSMTLDSSLLSVGALGAV